MNKRKLKPGRRRPQQQARWALPAEEERAEEYSRSAQEASPPEARKSFGEAPLAPDQHIASQKSRHQSSEDFPIWVHTSRRVPRRVPLRGGRGECGVKERRSVHWPANLLYLRFLFLLLGAVFPLLYIFNVSFTSAVFLADY